MDDDGLSRWFSGLDLGWLGPASERLTAAVSALPETVVIDGATVRIGTFLNRNFMPISPPDGKPMLAGVRVRADPAVLPSLRAELIAVICGAEVWVSHLVEETARIPDGSEFEAVGRNGPKWKPGQPADVVVCLRDGVAGRHLVRVPHQVISRSS
ncbi:hypothetical protein SAMN05421812_11191 [Asanoa hainanensis]|uniref:Uncharacterized protein n=1 Tax=Asanoa hainanensis TaxID=560556 RepID=A0A239NVN5_9ACTN|nr:hypothetical protein [Asanoa hainanensis]SNT58937.1 hypothetical protein SAMN05421812_11191 [Asanoa hainanensis]